MNHIFYECLEEFLVVYMNDLLEFSEDEESHLKHVETSLSHLNDHQLYVSPKKFEFLRDKIDLL